jgi:hypothetical protein
MNALLRHFDPTTAQFTDHQHISHLFVKWQLACRRYTPRFNRQRKHVRFNVLERKIVLALQRRAKSRDAVASSTVSSFDFNATLQIAPAMLKARGGENSARG